MTAAWLASLALGLCGPGQQQEQPPAPPPSIQEATPQERGRPFIDFDWLELSPRVGLAVFSDDYEADPAFFAGVLARAPMPWLSPASDPKGEHFGLFFEAALGRIERDTEPEAEQPDGMLLSLAGGVDYTIYRDESWLVMALAGAHFAHYGGVSELNDGIAPLAGITVGFQVAGGVSITASPEVVFARAGDRIMFLSLGAMIKF